MLKKKIIPALGMFLLLTSLFTISALADTNGGGKVQAGLLNLRDNPGMNGAIIATIPKDAFVLVEENLGDWVRVAYNGQTGYVAGAYLSTGNVMDGAYQFNAAVKGTSVRMRTLPDTSAPIVSTYNTGDALMIMGVNGNWLKVCAKNGAMGYIRSDLVNYAGTVVTSSTQQSAPEAVPSDASMGAKIVATAKQYLGYRYVWGGMSPETGFDCSGFVNYVYNQHGYKLERVAQNIYNSSGVSVSTTLLQPGDILCFGYSGSSITHVGIYIGGGEFIHASTSDTGVIISDLGSNYFTTRLIGAKRIV